MKSLNISIDVEPDLYGDSDKGIISGLDVFTKILDKYNIKSTFFVTARILEKYPFLFKKFKEEGHEISLHGYNHERFDDISFHHKKKLLNKSLNIYNEFYNSNPPGFRAPQHSIDNSTLNILRFLGFKYDSSFIPWNFHHILMPQIKIKFLNNFKRMKPKINNRFCIFPISSFFLPFSGLTLRFLPFSLLRLYFRFINLYNYKFFFVHSWDFIELPNSKMYQRCPLNKFIRRFEFMIKYFSKENYFKKIEDLC